MVLALLGRGRTQPRNDGGGRGPEMQSTPYEPSKAPNWLDIVKYFKELYPRAQMSGLFNLATRFNRSRITYNEEKHCKMGEKFTCDDTPDYSVVCEGFYLIDDEEGRTNQYPACAYFAVRCKAQWVAENFPEVKFLGQPKCSLLHDEGEWDPCFCKQSRRWVYPSKEEAEYTPALAFTIAVALTMSAAREGRMKLSIPRLPVAESSGSCCGWSIYDPRALRQWLMPVQARAIGLSPLED